jgi:hypothetical protein
MTWTPSDINRTQEVKPHAKPVRVVPTPSTIPLFTARGHHHSMQVQQKLLSGSFGRTTSHMEPSYYDEEDPVVREELILQQARDPVSWVSKSLARPDIWADSEPKASVWASAFPGLLNMNVIERSRGRSPCQTITNRITDRCREICKCYVGLHYQLRVYSNAVMNRDSEKVEGNYRSPMRLATLLIHTESW